LAAAAGALLALVVRGRSLALDLLLAATLTGGLALAVAALAQAAGLGPPRGLVAGAAACALLAAAAATAGRR
ncbi:MAG: NADH-quinone oxidoreductase subunit J, partial [Actinomycetota bacterium]|nr:NADH-quinone oxidoreductase subunit J [Actinomycetota bacterium]